MTRDALVNRDYIQSVLTHEAAWSESHDAKGDYLGWGMLYYSLCYSLRAQLCVCLGSGAGFVPRIMRQAQRDLGLKSARTVLVDANLPEAGAGVAQWPDEEHFFRRVFPDVEIMELLTVEAVDDFADIDLLHIDADHDSKAVTRDFELYEARMSSRGVITLHDTAVRRAGVRRLVGALRSDMRFDIVDFPQCSAGLALVSRVR